MQMTIDTYRKPVRLRITIKTVRPVRIRMIVKDANKDRPNTEYLNRFNTVNGIETFDLKLPQTPYKARLIVFNEANGLQRNFEDNSFQIIERKRLPLYTNLAMFDYASPTVANFLNFATTFCERVGMLSVNSVYISDNAQFRIDLLPNIRSLDTGRMLNTPARISQSKGVIEVSKERFSKFTVPGRMAILLHEFSHFYMNLTMKDEKEADYNAVNIYLGLGYPAVELLNVFAEVFLRADTPSNRERFENLKKYVMDYNKKVLVSVIK